MSQPPALTISSIGFAWALPEAARNYSALTACFQRAIRDETRASARLRAALEGFPRPHAPADRSDVKAALDRPPASSADAARAPPSPQRHARRASPSTRRHRPSPRPPLRSRPSARAPRASENPNGSHSPPTRGRIARRVAATNGGDDDVLLPWCGTTTTSLASSAVGAAPPRRGLDVAGDQHEPPARGRPSSTHELSLPSGANRSGGCRIANRTPSHCHRSPRAQTRPRSSTSGPSSKSAPRERGEHRGRAARMIVVGVAHDQHDRARAAAGRERGHDELLAAVEARAERGPGVEQEAMRARLDAAPRALAPRRARRRARRQRPAAAPVRGTNIGNTASQPSRRPGSGCAGMRERDAAWPRARRVAAGGARQALSAANGSVASRVQRGNGLRSRASRPRAAAAARASRLTRPPGARSVASSVSGTSTRLNNGIATRFTSGPDDRDLAEEHGRERQQRADRSTTAARTTRARPTARGAGAGLDVPTQSARRGRARAGSPTATNDSQNDAVERRERIATMHGRRAASPREPANAPTRAPAHEQRERDRDHQQRALRRDRETGQRGVVGGARDAGDRRDLEVEARERLRQAHPQRAQQHEDQHAEQRRCAAPDTATRWLVPVRRKSAQCCSVNR